MTMQRQFTLYPTRYLAITLIAMHGIALVALLLLSMPPQVLAMLGLPLFASAIFYLRRDAWLSAPTACVALLLDGDRIVLTGRNGERLVGQMLPHSLITSLLTVLNVALQDSQGGRSIIILPDSLDAESFRQIRVHLKWESNSLLTKHEAMRLA